MIHELITAYKLWKSSGTSRQELLIKLSMIPGVYVPGFYQVQYKEDYAIDRIDRLNEHAKIPVIKRIVPHLPPPPTHFIVPNIETVHNLSRLKSCGDVRGCRFCHAGMVMRPIRERSIDEIPQPLDESLRNTGFEEIGLLSLSSSDYTHISDLVKAVTEKYNGKHLGISLDTVFGQFHPRVERSSECTGATL